MSSLRAWWPPGDQTSPRWPIFTAVATAVGQRGIGAVYGTNRDAPFDRWFRYPAGFSKEALQLADSALGSDPCRIVDPFLGSAAAATGLSPRYVVGIEAHPLIADLAATKLREPPKDPGALRSAAQELLAQLEEPDTAVVRSEHALIQKCFDQETLAQLVSLRSAVTGCGSSEWRPYLRWALIATLRDVARVKVGWPYQRPDVMRTAPHKGAGKRFLARANMIADDLESKEAHPTGCVVRGDSRSSAAWTNAVKDGSFDACVTSPPYLNNFDYADATRLELYFLGTASSWGEMCQKVRTDMLVATTQQSSRKGQSHANSRLKHFPSIADDATSLTKRLEAERKRRTRGKEYDQVLPAYLLGMSRVLSYLHKHLKAGGVAAWIVGDSAPYGVYIDTPQLIVRLATDLGFDPLDDIVVRSRGLRWRTNGSRHQVPLSERLITFRRADSSS